MYLGRWDSLKDMIEAFEITENDVKGCKVLLASYGGGSYEGDAYVLFKKGGKLYEVHGSHCSCYGLERQWTPEETTVESIKHRLQKGNLGNAYDHHFAYELTMILAKMKDKAPEIFQGVRDDLANLGVK